MSDHMTTELLPCPNCGAESTIPAQSAFIDEGWLCGSWSHRGSFRKSKMCNYAESLRRASPPAPERRPLNCPECGKPHVDRDEWATKPHHTHLCEHCGHEWRVEPYAFGIEPVPVPAASDRERAGAFLKTKLRMYNFDPAHFYTGRDVDDLAAEFAAVRADQKERDAKVCLEAEDCAIPLEEDSENIGYGKRYKYQTQKQCAAAIRRGV